MRIKNVWRKHRKRRIPQLNTVATADISFMLLIFFLVTTSIDSDRVLRRQLPPREANKEIRAKDVDRNNVITVCITKDNKLTVNNEEISEQLLCNKLSDFIKKKGDKHIIEVRASTTANYDTYFHLQNSIVEIYRNVRNDSAMSRYHMPFNNCDSNIQSRIREAYPQRISEVFTED